MPIDHYENFPVASLLLPKHLRQPVEAIYHFARSADDIADEGEMADAVRLQQLVAYHDQLNQIERGKIPEAPLFATLAATINTWHLPTALFHHLLDAFAQDVVKKRYADFPELLDYCRRSANPVGRLLLHLVGRTSEVQLYQSDCICSALQLTNFWQDIAVDWDKQRVYLPQDELLRFKVSEAQIAEQRWSPEWAALLDFQIERTQGLMREGAPLIHHLPGRMAWEIRFTIQGGLRILERLRNARGHVFRQRPQLRLLDWLTMARRACIM